MGRINLEDKKVILSGFVEFKKDSTDATWIEYIEPIAEADMERGRHYVDTYDLFTIESFTQDHEEGYLIPDDGSIAGIMFYVNGKWYGTNAGLNYGSFYEGGEVIVDGEDLLELAKEYPIFVNWANK